MSSEDNTGESEPPAIPGRPQDLIFSTEVVSDEQEKSTAVKKKSKCRGNRKIQRFRAKLRRQGLNAEAITHLIDAYNQNPSEPDK